MASTIAANVGTAYAGASQLKKKSTCDKRWFNFENTCLIDTVEATYSSSKQRLVMMISPGPNFQIADVMSKFLYRFRDRCPSWEDCQQAVCGTASAGAIAKNIVTWACTYRGQKLPISLALFAQEHGLNKTAPEVECIKKAFEETCEWVHNPSNPVALAITVAVVALLVGFCCCSGLCKSDPDETSWSSNNDVSWSSNYDSTSSSYDSGIGCGDSCGGDYSCSE
jgi:hypothetical protein